MDGPDSDTPTPDMPDTDGAATLQRLLSTSTPAQRAQHLLRLVEEAGDACLRLPELNGTRLLLHNLHFDAEALRARLDGADTLPGWWHSEGRVQLRGASFRGADLHQAAFTRVDLTGADFSAVVMRAATLDDAGLETARFTGADLTATSFARALASQADFTDALLEDTRFGHAVLRFANFTGALLEQADLSDADLWGARLDRAEAHGALFRDAVLREASLAGADLTGTDLTGAKLTSTDLTDARLRGANLRGALLGHAKLAGADLTEAELVQVNLLSCDLRHVRLAGAWMERTRLHIDQLGGALGEEVSGDWSAARQGYIDLEQNFRSLGDAESASWCYRRARRMGRRASAAKALAHWRTPWRQRDWRGFGRSAVAWASDTFVEWLCDYGDSLPRVIRAYVTALGCFTAYYFLSSSLLHQVPRLDGGAWEPTHDLVEILEFSILNMVTSNIPDLGLKLASRATFFVSGLQYVIGVVLIGLFGFVLGNRIRR